MSFFQNVFSQEFIGDRHLYLNFEVSSNKGRGSTIVSSFGVAPFNLSGNDAAGNSKSVLSIGFAIDSEYKLWTYINIDITSASASASNVSVAEIVSTLNSNIYFSERFEAIDNKESVQIRQKTDSTKMKFYIVNGRAETLLKFNNKAGIAEMHSDLEKHLISNRFNDNSLGIAMLVKLDPANTDDKAIITNADSKNGVRSPLDPNSPTADSALLKQIGATDIVTARLATDLIQNGNTVLTPKFVTIAASSSGNNTLIAAVAGKKIRVLSYTLVAASSVTATFQNGASGTAISGIMSFAANGGVSVPFSPVGHFETSISTLLNLSLSGAVSVAGHLCYVEV